MNALQRHQREIDTQQTILDGLRKWPDSKVYRTAEKNLRKLLTNPMYEDAVDEAREMLEEMEMAR